MKNTNPNQIGIDFDKVVRVLKSSKENAHIDASDRMFDLFKKKWGGDRKINDRYLTVSDIYNIERESILASVGQ